MLCHCCTLRVIVSWWLAWFIGAIAQQTIAFFPPVLWYREKLVFREEAFRSVPAQVLWVLGPKCTVSSAVET